MNHHQYQGSTSNLRPQQLSFQSLFFRLSLSSLSFPHHLQPYRQSAKFLKVKVNEETLSTDWLGECIASCTREGGRQQQPLVSFQFLGYCSLESLREVTDGEEPRVLASTKHFSR
jgi:hypothetical protein